MTTLLSSEYKIVPLIEPHAITATVHRSTYVDCDLMHWVNFIVNWGAVTTGAGASCDSMTITVECSSVQTSAGAEVIPFTYTLNGPMATDQMLAQATAGTSDGVSISCSDLVNSVLTVSVDPAILPGRGEKYRFVTICITPVSTTAATCGVIGVCFPRYSMSNIPSSS